MLIWASSSIKAMTNPNETTISRVSEETSFITAWVILAFLLFEYATNIAGLDLQSWFNTIGIAVPIIAILIGFIPGCGPQILVTTFYINGLIPFSALIGNSIANDGDALFPAIAINPKVALIATIYSSIPLQASGAKSCMPPKALSRFAERGAGWRTPSPTSALEFSLRTKTATRTRAAAVSPS